jgi:hypothetical protein
MISDMVLIKEIPETILKNAEAYIGCIAGAENKNEYLSKISRAGFIDVQVIEEATMPYESLVSDATIKRIMKELKITKEKTIEFFRAAVSIKVSATKP